MTNDAKCNAEQGPQSVPLTPRLHTGRCSICGCYASPAEQVPESARTGEHPSDRQLAGVLRDGRSGTDKTPAPAVGPRSSIHPSLSAWLEEIREYLSSRQDVDDGSDGPKPNEEMTLLSNLDEALRRPIEVGAAGPSAVDEWLSKGYIVGLRHAEALDRLRAENERLLKAHEFWRERAIRAERRAERAEAALRSGVVVSDLATVLLQRAFDVLPMRGCDYGTAYGLREEIGKFLAAAKEGK